MYVESSVIAKDIAAMCFLTLRTDLICVQSVVIVLLKIVLCRGILCLTQERSHSSVKFVGRVSKWIIIWKDIIWFTLGFVPTVVVTVERNSPETVIWNAILWFTLVRNHSLALSVLRSLWTVTIWKDISWPILVRSPILVQSVGKNFQGVATWSAIFFLIQEKSHSSVMSAIKCLFLWKAFEGIIWLSIQGRNLTHVMYVGRGLWTAITWKDIQLLMMLNHLCHLLRKFRNFRSRRKVKPRPSTLLKMWSCFLKIMNLNIIIIIYNPLNFPTLCVTYV